MVLIASLPQSGCAPVLNALFLSATRIKTFTGSTAPSSLCSFFGMTLSVQVLPGTVVVVEVVITLVVVVVSSMLVVVVVGFADVVVVVGSADVVVVEGSMDVDVVVGWTSVKFRRPSIAGLIVMLSASFSFI